MYVGALYAIYFTRYGQEDNRVRTRGTTVAREREMETFRIEYTQRE